MNIIKPMIRQIKSVLYIRRKNHFIQCISLVIFYFAAKVNIKHDNLAPNEVFKCTKHNVHIDNIIVWANKS